MSEQMLSMMVRWSTLVALMIAYWPGPAVHAAIEQTIPNITFQKSLYAGKLNWKGAPLRFEVGTIERTDTDSSRFAANLTRGKEVVATCKRVLIGESPFDANSMTLKCQGSLFKKKEATAKFYFGDLTGRPKLMIQDGKKATRPIALNEDNTKNEDKAMSAL